MSRLHSHVPFPPSVGPPSPSVSGADEDVLQIFFKERELNGDFISRASDILWYRKLPSSVDSDISILNNNTSQQIEQVQQTPCTEFLSTNASAFKFDYSSDESAPINKKMNAKMLQDSSARRKKLNILRYESLKKEILLVSVGIGLACSGYCLITLSMQAAISYAIGVFFRIGIRSEDLLDLLTRSVMGCSMSVSSPRLVIPATIYGLWVLSHLHFTNDFFDFQLVPAMFGMFVYKAAILVQVYRDNEELKLVFPENEEGLTD
ncbi:hypothetical protein RJT34_28718 [Clitoria ternatea]|uniref:CGL160/ATPI domain-containing protein n=1 Tax=Clitoria ternatea TaxID=43366 RepID=A0AAN9FBC0_CLITE